MGSLFGQTINPSPATSLYNQAYGTGGSVQQQQFLSNLAVATMGSPQGGLGYFQGVPGYQGQMTPDVSQTMLPSVYNSWQPWGAGTSYIANQMSQPGYGQMQQPYQTALQNYSAYGGMGGQPLTNMSNAVQYGGPGGYGTQLLHDMAQYGGTGGPGNYAMSSLLQTGMPSKAGQNMATIANTGTAGTWGGPLQSIAATSPYSLTAPFLTAKAYQPAWT